jgi:recombination protein RecA
MFKDIALSQEEISAILGGLLGDSSLRKKENNIVFKHSTKQREYINWKYNKLKNISGKITKHIDSNGFKYLTFNVLENKNKNMVHFYNIIRSLIYKKKEKGITRKYLNLLTPLSLAIWWMDDGCLSIHKGNRYGKLCTHCFTYEENLIIQKYFRTVWNIKIDVKLEKNKYYFCRINVYNLKKLIKIIYPYVLEVPSMIYKIDLNYKNNVNLGDFKDVYNEIKALIS